jgi:PAS domain S-box-containing protein
MPDEAIYRTLFLTSPDGVLVVDRAGSIVLANPRACELFGYPEQELNGMNVDRLVPEQARPAHAAHRDRYAREARLRPMGAGLLLSGRRRDGSEFPLEIALNPVPAEGGDVYVAAIRDMSELVRTKQAARRGRYSAFVARFGMEALAHVDFERLVRAAPTLVREAMEVDSVSILRLTPDRSRFVVAAASGVSSSALEGSEVPNDGRFLAGYVVQRRAAVLSRDFRSEDRFEVPERFRQLGLHAAAAVPLFDGEHAIGLIAARSREPRDFGDDDVNFLQSIANILATVLQRATVEEHLAHAQRLEALGQLTGGVAHDFNNLLMVISGNLQVLEEILPPGEAVELARAAAAAVDRGAMLTRKLLAFARRQPLQPRPVELGHLLRDFRDLVQRTLGETVAVHVEHERSLPPLLVDHAQLETALLNLAINARDAMPHGGTVKLSVGRCSVDQDLAGAPSELAPGEYACIEVTDSGVGMPKEVLERAFEPFFTTKEVGKGSGLGLSMVYGFAQQSGGSAHIYSEPGYGTTVRLFLPLPAQAAELPRRPAAHAAGAGRETILVVEDEPAVRNVAVMFLTRLGYRVLQAADAEAALRVLEHEGGGVELIFTDLVLPGMTGVELARQARARWPLLQVLYTSGYASGSVLEELAEDEIGNLVSKPYRREALAHMVRRMLDAQRPAS